MSQRANSILANDRNDNNSAILNRNENKQPTDFNNSPSKITVASYFNSNFDENGYVFDGVKIDVFKFEIFCCC